MGDYVHDIFVSYRRADEDWVRWTQEHFVRPLRSLLSPALGQVDIFLDQSVETGATWPAYLAHALSRSRLLIPILCRDYFRSDWCRLELSLMHHRERSEHLRTTSNPWGLIIPVIIDDGDCFPMEIRQMQSEGIHEYANPFMRSDSPKQEALAERLRTRLCPAICTAMHQVPPFNPEWERMAHDGFSSMFEVHAQAQTAVPAMSRVKPQ